MARIVRNTGATAWAVAIDDSVALVIVGAVMTSTVLHVLVMRMMYTHFGARASAVA